jgi:flagellar hook-associated protein 3 FlgL
MRVTPITIANDIIYNLENTYQTIQTYDQQLSSGKRINQPSDDPAGTAFALDMQASSDWNTQYQSSSQSAQSWLQSTSTALQQLSDVAMRARTLTVQAANDSNTSSDRVATSQEIAQLQQQVVQIGNTTYEDLSIFGGTQVSTTPFNSQGGYAGDTGAIMHQIGPGYDMQVNANPTTIFTGTGGIFNVLNTVFQHMNTASAFTPTQNAGSETLNLTGTYTGAAANYTVQVTGVTAGKITAIQYSTTGGAPWTPVAGVGSPPTFALPSGMSASFTNGALTPTVGDQFTVIASGPGNSASFTTQATKNIGNEQVTLTNPSTLAGNPAITVRASQLDVNNNVIGVQVSTDGGVTFSPTIMANEVNSTAEKMSFDGSLYTGPSATYLVRVASVGGSGQPATIVTSTNNGATWSAPIVGVGSPPTFTVAAGLNLSFSSGTAQVNDQFSFNATAGGVGQNVAGITALPYPTTTTFAGGNGLTFSWAQSSVNPSLVVTNNDTFTYTPATTGLNSDLASLDAVIAQLAGQEAQFGAKTNAVQANITQLQTINTTTKQSLSNVADADIAAVSTQMATANTVYQAALAVDARSIEPTLVEFLK